MAIVTGRTSLTEPEYSPISSSVRDVRLSSSSFHCRADTVLVTRISVVVELVAIAAAPTRVLPAPQGSTTTPLPPAQKFSVASCWYGPELPAGFVEHDGVRRAVDVAGQVLRRPADLEQQLLELAALGGMHHHGLGVDPRPEQRGDLLGAADFFEHRVVGRAHHQAVLRVLFQPQPAVPGHGLFDVDQQRMRHREPGVLQQRVQHLFGVEPGGPGVPQSQRRQPVAVDMLRRALQLGERRDGVAGLGGQLVVDFQQDGLVALDDQGPVIHWSSSSVASTSMIRWMDSTRSVSLSGSNTRTRPPFTATGTTVSRLAFPMPSTTFMTTRCLSRIAFCRVSRPSWVASSLPGAACGAVPAAAAGAAGRRCAAPPAGRRRRRPAARCAGRCRPAGRCRARRCRGAAGRRRTRPPPRRGTGPGLRSTWAVSRGAACEITTVGAMRTSPRPAAAGALSRSSRAVSSSLWMKLAAAPTRSRRWRAAVSSIRYCERLRDGGGRMLAQEVQHRRGVLAGVEGPADRCDGEAVDGCRPLAFGVGHGEQLVAQFRVKIARCHRGQVRLQQHVVQGCGQVFAQDAQGVVRLLVRRSRRPAG